ncbi:MAG: metal-dependent hydrolase [Patescibacteria group bacterium]
MFILGHLAAGYLAAKGAIALASPALSPADTHLLSVLGGVVGALPDIDLIPYFLRNHSVELRPDASHRDYLSHAPMLWCFLGLSVAFVAAAPLWSMFGVILWLSSWSHFLADTIGGRVAWLWPFTRSRFGFALAPEHAFLKKEDEGARAYYTRLFLTAYVTRPVFWIELLLVASAVAAWIQ